MSEITYSMFKVACLFTLVSAGSGDIMAPRNPTNEMDTWKGKCEAKELRFSTL